MVKNLAFAIKSSLWEGIFVDDKSVICTSLETACQKNILLILLKAPRQNDRNKLYSVSEFI